MMATQEQTAGIEQINEAIVQMDDVTQQNAAWWSKLQLQPRRCRMRQIISASLSVHFSSLI
jgi:methyl-accepting chemotaxis protein